MKKSGKTRAPRNRTLSLTDEDRRRLDRRLLSLHKPANASELINTTICADLFSVLPHLPAGTFDLVFADPPYNLDKVFGKNAFQKTGIDEYETWLSTWLPEMHRLLTPNGSIYVCGDWRSSPALYRVLEKHFRIKNRITWQREKGRGAKKNWKNSHEDIWFAVKSPTYTFHTEAVKIRKRVIAPYRESGKPKDWEESDDGNVRMTHPSNLWTDLTVPFWSMPENTEHPTQKPEKLLAKILLASTRENDIVFDPFLGAGTTSVTARKLGRRYCGVESDRTYCLLAERRLELAETDPEIQGYTDGIFWERNTLLRQKQRKKKQQENTLDF